MSLGNLPEYVWSQIDSIQLVALCREKYFNHQKVYGIIVEDLKQIEQEGLEVECNTWIKGTIAFIVGDNLGNHELGGFCQNFSRLKFFCRHCLIDRNEKKSIPNENDARRDIHIDQELEENDSIEDLSDTSSLYESSDSKSYVEAGESSDDESSTESLQEEDLDDRYFLKIYKKRTIETYCEAFTHIVKNKNYQGIKFNSEFNKLNYYHVYMPGLCPYCGHEN